MKSICNETRLNPAGAAIRALLPNFFILSKTLRTSEGENVPFIHLGAKRILHKLIHEKFLSVLSVPGTPGNFQLRPLGPSVLHQEKSGQIAYCPAELGPMTASELRLSMLFSALPTRLEM